MKKKEKGSLNQHMTNENLPFELDICYSSDDSRYINNL